MAVTLTNWAGNYVYRAGRVHEPGTVDELRDIVRRASAVKVIGTRHSFNDVADTTGDLISLRRFDQIDPIDRSDPRRPRITVGAGVTYGQLCRSLCDEGCAVPNLASLPHISVAGACATATHGSGDGNRVLAGSVVAMELVMADGEMHTFSRDRDRETFDGMVVHLGGLGAVARLTLELVPAFDVRQDVYEDLSLASVRENFDAITSAGYSVSLFTDWRGERFNQVWIKRRVDHAGDGTTSADTSASREFFGATPATRDLHPIGELSAEHCTAQLGLTGPWHERLPHFRMDHTPSSGEELQSEYFVPRHHAVSALEAISSLRDQIAPLLHISEIRTIAADELWMSPCYQQPCVAIHFTWHKNWPAVRALLPAIEQRLSPFAPRPHWGKLFTMLPRDLVPRYKRLHDFRQLLQRHDPTGKFRNAFLERCIFGTS